MSSTRQRSVQIDTVRLDDLDAHERAATIKRSVITDPALKAAVAAIVASVKEGGNSAVGAANAAYGGGRAKGPLRVEQAELASAAETLSEDLTAALLAAGERIRLCHQPQRPVDHDVDVSPGVRVRRRWSPLPRVGIYVPGGRTAYPSSLLMAAIPAHVAGVPSIAVATPANERGEVSKDLLGTAALLGIDEVYGMGGAQAIAALAYGTETIPAVNKVVGPGNAWVTTAKLEVVDSCEIDLPAGPSESLLVADDTADARVLAADLLCQAEHGPDSLVVLVTTEAELPAAVLGQIDELLPLLDRREVIETALAERAMIVIAPNREATLRFANDFAPEHAGFHTADPRADAVLVPSVGSAFLGHWTPHSAGDYATGANHILPTGGRAAARGPLGVEDFGSWRQEQELTEEGLSTVAPVIRALATAEGMGAHRLCLEVRLEAT